MSDIMQDLAHMAERQEVLEAEVAQAEARLKQAKAELDLVAELIIPTTMERLGLEIYRTSTGLSVEVEKKVRASIKKENLIPALDWLRKHDHAALIKREITVIPSDDAQGQRLMEVLSGFEVSDMPSVNAQTLGKFVREKLADGEDIPLDLFGVYYQPRAKVKR